MLKPAQLAKTIKLQDTECPIALGDPVWWFQEAQLQSMPQVGTIVEILEDNMLTLNVQTNTAQPKLVRKEGVCLAQDSRLTNQNFRSRGCWVPRALWPFLIGQ